MTSANAQLQACRARGAQVDGHRLEREQVLRRLAAFGRRIKHSIDDFRTPEQELAVYKVLEGQHLLVIMPTGSGKSLVYQFPAFLEPRKLTLVVSPLKALIKQQDDLLPFGVGLTGDKNAAERKAIWDSLVAGHDHVLLVSPEMLASRAFQKELRHNLTSHGLVLGRFVVDEVHCLSDWGHDFRPHYWWVAHHLRALEQVIPSSVRSARMIPRLLLTATADKAVTKDITRHFPEVQDCVQTSVSRPELILSAREVKSAVERERFLVKFLKRQATRPLPAGTRRRGIVFNLEAMAGEDDDGARAERRERDRAKTDDIVLRLKRHGFRRVHAFASKGMNAIERELALEAFEQASKRKGQVTIVVATNAFGMGMDFPKVPFVCHYYPRPSVCEYFQQVGRAGREFRGPEEWAEALALFSRADSRYARRFAKAPALDGLLNALTTPLHGWMYVSKRHGGDMSLRGAAGGATRFSKLVGALQECRVLSKTANTTTCPKGMVRYRVDIEVLRRMIRGRRLDSLQRDDFDSKKLRKVFRYLRIAGVSKRRRQILLDQTLYSQDKAGTVLQRLNRWVDSGTLEMDPEPGPAGTVRLRASKRSLTTRMIRRIATEARRWERHKADAVAQAMRVLRAPNPLVRQRLVLEHFGDKNSAAPVAQQTLPGGLAAWLRSTR